MKRIGIFFIGSALAVSSCTKDISSLNKNPKAASEVPSYTLFSNAQLNMANNHASPSVFNNIFRLIAQQWSETSYTTESNYDIGTNNLPQAWWHNLYRDVLKNLDESKKLIPNDVLDLDVRKNQIAIVEIMEVFTYHYIVTTFGNIPYDQALNIDNLQPSYDDAAGIYSKLLNKLNGAINNLNASAASFGGADLVYKGDVAKWKKFANSFRLKMGMMMADYDGNTAKAAVEAAAAGVFASNSDNAVFKFQATTPNTNPVWVNLIQSGRNDFVPASTLVNTMKSLSDPRLPLFFTKDATDGYSGGAIGATNTYANFSHFVPAITAADFPTWFMDYAEVEFLLAEAKERGFNVPGTAEEHYNKAVTASILFWGGSQADADNYLANAAVKYTTATGSYKQKIGIQKWIALFERGNDAWTEFRRLDYPALVAPPTAFSPMPVRYTYPVSEQTLNRKNYTSASAAIGGDRVDVKLWFDKF